MHLILPFLNSSQFLSYFLYFQGLCKIRLDAKLNEAAARYSREGWHRFYLAVTGTDCNYVLDLLCELFNVNYCPRQEISEFTNCSTGNLVNRTKYYCQMCTYSSFNRDSTYTHTHQHLNVVIGCAHPSFDKKYEAPDSLSKHIKSKHNGKLVPEGIKQEETEAVVAGLAASSSTW